MAKDSTDKRGNFPMGYSFFIDLLNCGLSGWGRGIGSYDRNSY